jgi:hypothetical protein
VVLLLACAPTPMVRVIDPATGNGQCKEGHCGELHVQLSIDSLAVLDRGSRRPTTDCCTKLRSCCMMITYGCNKLAQSTFNNACER